MVLGGILARRAPGVEVVGATGVALVLFLGAEAGLVPSTIGPLRTDLLLLGTLAVITVGTMLVRRTQTPRPEEADVRG
jgi:hypothetical protein